MELQQLLQLRAAFVGTPSWNDAECQKRALELINPDLVKFLYIDVPTGIQDQSKNQADEIATMSFGFEPMPSQEDNDLVHIQTIEQFKSHVISTGHQLPPDFMMVLIRHEDAHIKAMQKKDPGHYKINTAPRFSPTTGIPLTEYRLDVLGTRQRAPKSPCGLLKYPHMYTILAGSTAGAQRA
jgi:hypothetical protein